MKTTEFFKVIKKVQLDSTIESVFAYGVDHDKHFYEIFLYSEPSEKVKSLCEKNGFSIEKNRCAKEVNGKMVDVPIWEVHPINAEDIEFDTCDEGLKNVNENVIIATDQAMINAGLIKCNPREGEITIWTYELNQVWNEMQWTPIMRVFEKPLLEDIKDEDGRVIEQKSTHKIDSFYGAPVSGSLDLTRYLTRRGINVSLIEA